MIYSKVVPVDVLSEKQISEMFILYSKYYSGTNNSLFYNDLSLKNQVILLQDESEKIEGFSTVALIETQFEGRPIRALFSGDTIVAHGYWGKNNLAQEWLRYAGGIKREASEIPLFWLLIVKGHRTYRYLDVFSRSYYPTYKVATPAREKNIIDHLSRLMFGSTYDPEKGILHFPESRGHLAEQWADIDQKDLSHPEVRYFLERNPGYRQGDELVCLCELEVENLKPFSQRLFNRITKY